MSNYLNNHNEQKISWDSLISSLQELNNHRNIIVHENSDLILKEDQIIAYLKHTELLYEGTNHIINKILYPNAPTTQTEMNQFAFVKAEEIDKEIRGLIYKISTYIREKGEKVHIKQLLTYYKQREKSIEEYGKFKADFYEGGSIYPLIYHSAITEAREKFFDELKQNFINYNGEIEIHPLSLYEE
ncbi:hypothetical protein Lgra_0232 [Legionella gratiana]|uniref:Uncharacterized protein n=1 Tax=Legionella gratiana TaxID=45066 RepID=A0A378JCH7_9GAMM|nr:hypothetical protein [Legionella gratiana]KTD15566.1 hypothetical protein Lgra_0232 [Legionella gratiana]STX44681.1 Uncharacterised protein [Legionella gratiana]